MRCYFDVRSIYLRDNRLEKILSGSLASGGRLYNTAAEALAALKICAAQTAVDANEHVAKLYKKNRLHPAVTVEEFLDVAFQLFTLISPPPAQHLAVLNAHIVESHTEKRTFMCNTWLAQRRHYPREKSLSFLS